MRRLTTILCLTLAVLLGSTEEGWSANHQFINGPLEAFFYGLGMLVYIGSALIYLIPTIIAMFRGHKRKGMIFLVNLCVGWTVLGWLFLIIYAAGFIGGGRGQS